MKSKTLQFIAGISLAVTAALAFYGFGDGFAPLAFAQSEGFVPCGNTAGDPCTVGHLFRAFVLIINYLIVMAGFVAVLAIVYAGLLMVWSRGDDGSGLKEAKGRLSGAVIGLVIVAAAYVLINALFAGSLSVGVCNGETILTDPRAYINGTNNCN